MNRNRSRFLAAALAAVLVMPLSACGKGSKKNVRIDGVDGPNVSFVDGKFTMTVVLKGLEIDAGARIPIPKMPRSYLEIGPDFQSNGYLISIGLDAADVKDLAGDPGTLDPTTLPGGRPLPGIAGGNLPGAAVQVPKLRDLVFYVGSTVFGVFVPVRLPWKDYVATFRFYDAAGQRIGNISVVGGDAAAENSGILLMIDLQGKVAALVAAAG